MLVSSAISCRGGASGGWQCRRPGLELLLDHFLAGESTCSTIKWGRDLQLTGLVGRITLDHVHKARLLAQRRHATNVSSPSCASPLRSLRHTNPALPGPPSEDQHSFCLVDGSPVCTGMQGLTGEVGQETTTPSSPVGFWPGWHTAVSPALCPQPPTPLHWQPERRQLGPTLPSGWARKGRA